MTAFLQISTSFSALNLPPHDCLKKQQSFWGSKLSEPSKIYTISRRNIQLVCKYWLKTRVSEEEERLAFLKVRRRNKDGIFIREEKGWKRSKRVVLVRFNQGFGFNGLGGGGGGGGRDKDTTARVLGNLALAIGLTYLTMTGQLGWVLDAIVSVWVSVCQYVYFHL